MIGGSPVHSDMSHIPWDPPPGGSWGRFQMELERCAVKLEHQDQGIRLRIESWESMTAWCLPMATNMVNIVELYTPKNHTNDCLWL
jgi:hypothetical protein